MVGPASGTAARSEGASVARALPVAAVYALAVTTLGLLIVLTVAVPRSGLVAHLPAMLQDAGAALTAAIVTVAGAIAFRRPTANAIAEWLHRHALPPAMAATAVGQLQRLRTLRAVPALFGFAVAGVTGSAYNVAIDVLGTQHPASRALLEVATMPLMLVLTFGGYLLGVLLAEVTRRPPADGAGARLETRRPGQYLTPTARRLPAALAAVVVAAVAVGALVGGTQAWWPALVAPAVPVAVALAQHFIVRRPQPLVDADALALDDTLRSSAAHALSGGASALLLAWALDAMDHVLAGADGISSLAWLLPGLAGTLGVYGLWVHYGSAHRGRRPERPDPSGSAEVVAR